MDNRLMHYEFPHEPPQLDPDGTIDINKKIAAVVEDATDKAIVAAILAAARAEEVTDLYLIDKKFIMDAIREKQERENPKPLTIEELREMNGEPVWVAEFHVWAIIEVDDVGGWKGVPFAHGWNFNWNLDKKLLHCFRHKPKEDQK